MHTAGSLSDIRVIDLSRMLPGPYCSMILADHGAEVIAIEDRRFQKDGLFFDSINRNKKHMCLNLKAPEGKEIFFKLAGNADVIIEGFRPGVVKRLGVDYESIKEINPGVVYCSITGYGQTGPYRDRAGHDVNYLSTAGILDLVGPADGPPSIPGVQFADIAGGSMNAVVGILLALFSRSATQKGQYIDISMTDGLLGYQSLPYFFSRESGKQPRRSDELLSHRFACYNTYETGDGRYIAVGAVENRFWKQLCDCLKVPDYADLQYDEEQREQIIAAFRQLFRKKTADQWEDLLADFDVCSSRVQTLAETLNHPLFIQRQMVVSHQGRDGVLEKMLGIPIKLSETPGSLRTAPERFGESSTNVLLELGYSAEQVEAFRQKEII